MIVWYQCVFQSSFLLTWVLYSASWARLSSSYIFHPLLEPSDQTVPQTPSTLLSERRENNKIWLMITYYKVQKREFNWHEQNNFTTVQFFSTGNAWITKNVSVWHGCPSMTKSHNSCKTCSIAKSLLFGHYHVCWSLCMGMNKIH